MREWVSEDFSIPSVLVATLLVCSRRKDKTICSLIRILLIPAHDLTKPQSFASFERPLRRLLLLPYGAGPIRLKCGASIRNSPD